MTDLQQYVDAPGRDDLVKQVRAKIDELGITYVYYQFISVTGRIVGKGIPARHWERTAAKGFQLVYGSTANLAIDRHGDYIGYGPEASELVGIADPDTILDNHELISALDSTKQTAKTIEIQAKEAEQTEIQINLERNNYRAVAAEGAMLYF